MLSNLIRHPYVFIYLLIYLFLYSLINFICIPLLFFINNSICLITQTSILLIMVCMLYEIQTPNMIFRKQCRNIKYEQTESHRQITILDINILNNFLNPYKILSYPCIASF